MSEALQEVKDVQALLDRPINSFERPKPRPVGWYAATIMSRTYTRSSQKDTPGVELEYRIEEPVQDVDPQILKETGGCPFTLSETMWITEAASFRIRELGSHIGLPDSGKSLREIIELLPGNRVKVYIMQRKSNRQGGNALFNNISATLPL